MHMIGYKYNVLCPYIFAESSKGSDVSPSNWTGLVDLEEEAMLHSADACESDY